MSFHPARKAVPNSWRALERQRRYRDKDNEPSRTLPDWGTPITPEEAAKIDGEIGNLWKIVLGQVPPKPGPGNTA